ncbi:MAG: phospholipid carrier-dependent glycosyltransferase [Christensenellales bacterium]|jgi:dolichyl-phosphate-mannose-protein mannosyltransferase
MKNYLEQTILRKLTRLNSVGKIKDVKQLRKWQNNAKRRLFYQQEGMHFARKDWLVMLAVTLIYAIVAFSNLGSFNIPQTFFTMGNMNDEIIVQFEQNETITDIKYFTSLGEGKVSFFYSNDGEGYTLLTGQSEETDENGNTQTVTAPVVIDHKATDMYEWQFIPASFSAKYVSIRVDKPGIQMLEMGFCGAEGDPVKIVSVENINPDAPRGNAPANLFDEQQYVPKQTYYMNEMYFDEVYHARTAYEQINHLTPYEITHPPLGKTILGIGIQIFGMNPFGWRCMGTFFGVLMLPLMYVLAKKLFKKTLFAFIPTFLMAVDFMHYSQTRIATIDSYSVFFIMLMYLFMYMYTESNYNRQPLIKTLIPLGLCGVAFGLGAATKWLCMYAGAGLALLLFVQLFKRYREYAYARFLLSQNESCEQMDEGKRTFLEDISHNYVRKTFITLLWCVLFFIVVPLVIYYLAYIPYMQVADNPYDFAAILRNQEYMYNYHSNLSPESPHPFSSDWYTWPLNIRPVFLFQGKGYPQGYMSSMSTMGNPAVWWGGIGAVIALVVIRIRKGKLGKRVFFLSVAALSQYLPWVLVSRETFIYHYFATIPFLILLIGALAKYIIEHLKYGKKIVLIYLGICLVLFAMFYPVTTGLVIPRAYSDTFLRWLQSWPFY